MWGQTWGSVTASSSNRPEGGGTPWTPGLGLTFVLVVQERTGSDPDAREVRDQERRETVQRYDELPDASGRPVPQWAGLAESAGAGPGSRWSVGAAAPVFDGRLRSTLSDELIDPAHVVASDCPEGLLDALDDHPALRVKPQVGGRSLGCRWRPWVPQ